ncbi:MAG: hypothetical protein M3Y17_15240 [Actinomycetota bacterium]|nr:hypothetical protein [Actinomycetota bacterium]
MHGDDEGHGSFEERLRSIARELGRSVEGVAHVDLDEIAEAVGMDPDRARLWVDSAGGWLRTQAESLGGDAAFRGAGGRGRAEEHPPRGARPPGTRPRSDEDPLRGAGPHPLDVPTEEQGLALAALESGRWTVEPGSSALAARGEGPGPSDALGLVRELRARDWIAADGAVTLVGRDALKRWLDATNPR